MLIIPTETESSAGFGLGNMFKDPNLFDKLAKNPKTASLLSDAAFAEKVQSLFYFFSCLRDLRYPLHCQLRQIQMNPRLADTALQDPRMITVMGVLLGIDMQGFSRPEGSDELPPDMPRQPPTSAPNSTPSASASKPKEPEDVKMADPESEEDEEEAKAKKEAEVEKQNGTAAYKKRDFEAAAKSFERAWEIWPKDITFLTNLAGLCQACVVLSGQ